MLPEKCGLGVAVAHYCIGSAVETEADSVIGKHEAGGVSLGNNQFHVRAKPLDNAGLDVGTDKEGNKDFASGLLQMGGYAFYN